MSANYTMKSTRFCLLALFGFIVFATTPNFVLAQSSGSSDAVVSDFLKIYNTSTDKVAQLADAIPTEKYDWRPAEGIRSVKESVLHLAAGNYFFGSQLGAAIPEGVDPQSMEKSNMDKEEAIAAFKESVEYVKNAVEKMDAEVMNTMVNLMGNEMTKRQAVFILGDHAAEHLGQLIAYARMNDVTPPWSEQQPQ